MTKHVHPRLRKKVKPTYSRFGTFVAISLAVYAFVVVPIKLLVDSSPAAAIAFGVFAGIFVVTVISAFVIPVKQREAAKYTVRRPMELDPSTFDSTKDGVSW